VTNWSYDAAGRLLTDEKQDGEENILYGNTYVYDALGNRTSHTDLNGVKTYQYNGLNQLCMVQYPYPLNRARRIDYEVFQDAASLRVAAR
jgi:hypothetical protein